MEVAPLPISFIISLTFGLHIILVNLDIALSTFIPLLEWRGRKRGDEFLLERARALMKYFASAYALAGVFGTAFTVVLLSFYPAFVGLAGHLTWVPFGVAILMIVLRFLLVGSYWYLWDRIRPGTHLMIGGLLALTGFLVPFGFRAVFAFLNAPAGLRLEPHPHLVASEALANPTFLPLWLKSVFGALAAGSLVLVTAYTVRYARVNEELRPKYLELVKGFAGYAFASLVLMVFFGGWYAVSLTLSPYKFANIFGFLTGKPGALDFGWAFTLKMLLVLLQFVAVGMLLRGEGLDETSVTWAKWSGPLALGTILIGELLNMHSQLPYFIAQPEVVEGLPEIFKKALMTTYANPLAETPELYLITALFLIPLLAVMAFFIYILYLRE